ncbi:hypothetical protein [Pseudalkalibacillus sp. SCS-8]|uniref:hypothetical protein n=1 Tax=Pseudalkalibacillus nanhaiensis TaxID=3115291 RepID=UPI0032DA72DA
MNNHNKVDQELISRLREHPHKDPRPQFVEELRNQLERHESKPGGMWNGHLRAVLSICASILIVLVLISSQFTKEQNAVENPATNTTSEEDELKTLLSSNEVYQPIYENLVEKTGWQKQSESVISFLESARTGDEEQLHKIIKQKDKENIQQSIVFFQQITLDELKIQSIQKNHDSYAIEFLFSLKDSTHQIVAPFRLFESGEVGFNHSFQLVDGTSEEFKLTEEEANVYKKFQEDQDVVHLKDLSPISIAKLYVQSSMDGDSVTEYMLYTTRTQYVQWTLKTHLEQAKNVNPNPEAIRRAFNGLGNGVFIKRNENEGSIIYEHEGRPMSFQMVKDENGIWKVAFMPIQ